MMYRIREGRIEVLLAHPGGPFSRKKDDGYWSIPKGEVEPGEDPLNAAVREFQEETGIKPLGPFHPLGSIVQRGGKTVHAWGFAGDLPAGHTHVCNTFRIEWPPSSGRYQDYLEIDRVDFFTWTLARRKLKDTQHPFLDRLATQVAAAVTIKARAPSP